jgi:hypothetical protein
MRDTMKPLAAYKLDKIMMLVKVLAEDNTAALSALCDEWNIEAVSFGAKSTGGIFVLDRRATIQRLARHALDSMED